MPQLIAPTIRLHDSWLASLDERGRGVHQDGWIVEDDTYLGAISLRHTLNDSLLDAGGHIGYGVRPTARRRGLATFALRLVLPKARQLGLTRVLLTCHDKNAGSARIIENNGGVREDVRDTVLGRTRRYWITL